MLFTKSGCIRIILPFFWQKSIRKNFTSNWLFRNKGKRKDFSFLSQSIIYHSSRRILSKAWFPLNSHPPIDTRVVFLIYRISIIYAYSWKSRERSRDTSPITDAPITRVTEGKSKQALRQVDSRFSTIFKWNSNSRIERYNISIWFDLIGKLVISHYFVLNLM